MRTLEKGRKSSDDEEPLDAAAEDADRARLLHELQVHQVELEAQQVELRNQNKALHAAREVAQDALRRYTDLYDLAPVGYFALRRDGTITQTNIAGADLVGQVRSRLVGKRLGVFIAESERGLLAAMLDRVFTVYERENCELTLNEGGAGERLRFVRIEAQREKGEESVCRAVVIDLSERQRTQQQLQVAASVWGAMDEAVMVADADNRIIAVNPAFTALTGHGAAQAIGQRTSLLRAPRHDADFYARVNAEFMRTGQWRGELWNRRRDGTDYLASLTIHILYDAEGAVLRRIDVFRDITAQRRVDETIWQQANYDSLTGLPNRQLFLDRLRQAIETAVRNERPMALLFIDLDRFKEINDTLGHEVGDLILIEASRRVAACVRGIDTTARIGGDEFTVIMADVDRPARVEQVAQNIIDALAQPFRCVDRVLHIGASIGITTCPGDSTVAKEVLRHADQAMYSAKAGAGGHYRYYTPNLQATAVERAELIAALRTAIAAGQMAVHFQPIVSLADGVVRKAEALLRWHHPQRGTIAPERFIPLAEESGLIDDIGDWVFREATRQAALWNASLPAGATPIQVSINKSPRQFHLYERVEEWGDWLSTIGLPASAVVIEITESALLGNLPDVQASLHQLKDMGMSIALDDFGTGYSALSYLTHFPIDQLKIDRSFIQMMAIEGRSREVVEAIIVMAHKLGILVVAEGVETTKQRDLLVAAGCDFGQGELFGLAVPAAELRLR